jgi:predicted CoA-binding protein
MNVLADVRDFLAQKRIAMVGVSRNPKKFSHILFKQFISHGYEMIAVNPGGSEIEGSPSFARIEDVTPAPDAALMMTPHAVTEDMLHDWNSGIRRVWIYGTNGKTSVSPLATSRLRNLGVTIIDGECPFMFLNGRAGIHNLHGFVRKLLRNYPA